MTIFYPARVAPTPPRIFVSSTYFDLKSVRQELMDFLEILGLQPVLFEMAGAIPNIPAASSALQHAAQADLCLLIVGSRYGSSSEREDISYTHGEFRTALDMGRPIFIFVERETLVKFEMFRKRSESNFWNDEERHLFSFIEELSQRGTRFPFDSLPELKQSIKYQISSYFGYLIREYAQLDSIAPMTAMGWITLGNQLWNKRGQLGAALFCYRKALELDENHRFALENLARALRLTGRPMEAIPLLKKGIELYPGLSVYRRELAYALFYADEKDESIQVAELAAQEFPQDARVFTTLSEVYWNIERKEDAAKAAKKAYEIRPGSQDNYNRYCDLRNYLPADNE